MIEFLAVSVAENKLKIKIKIFPSRYDEMGAAKYSKRTIMLLRIWDTFKFQTQ